MSYLISQMWLCLLIAVIIAGTVGWLLRGNGKEKLQALDKQWRDQYHSIDNARRRYASQAEQLSPLKEKNNELALQVSLQKKSFEHTVRHLKEQTNIECDKQVELLTQTSEEFATNLYLYDKKIAELEEEKETNRLRFEKIIADKEEAFVSLSQFKKENEAKIAELETKLHISKADIASAEDELFTVKSELSKEKDQIIELKNGFRARENALKEQLNQKESLLSLAIADKEKAQKTSTELLEKFDDFKAEHREDDFTKASGHENKISSDLRNMFEATGISDLAKTGISKVRDRLGDMKKNL